MHTFAQHLEHHQPLSLKIHPMTPCQFSLHHCKHADVQAGVGLQVYRLDQCFYTYAGTGKRQGAPAVSQGAARCNHRQMQWHSAAVTRAAVSIKSTLSCAARVKGVEWAAGGYHVTCCICKHGSTAYDGPDCIIHRHCRAGVTLRAPGGGRGMAASLSSDVQAIWGCRPACSPALDPRRRKLRTLLALADRICRGTLLSPASLVAAQKASLRPHQHADIILD